MDSSPLMGSMVTAGLAESNGSLPPGLWITSPAGWLLRTGISSGTLWSVNPSSGCNINNSVTVRVKMQMWECEPGQWSRESRSCTRKPSLSVQQSAMRHHRGSIGGRTQTHASPRDLQSAHVWHSDPQTTQSSTSELALLLLRLWDAIHNSETNNLLQTV